MQRFALSLLLIALCGTANGCSWWKKNVMGEDPAAEERMTNEDMGINTSSRSLTRRSSVPGGISGEARAIERNLGVQ